VTEVLGSDVEIPWYRRRAHLDSLSGRAHARLKVTGSNGTTNLFVSAKRLNTPVEEKKTWAYYWSRPWELKEAWRAQPPVHYDSWEVETAFLFGDANPDPFVLHGDPAMHPGYQQCREPIQVKSQRSYDRLKVVGGIAGVVAVGAGIVRGYKISRMQQSYGYAKKYLMNHETVKNVLGAPVRIEQSAGTFKPTFINAEIGIRGSSSKTGNVLFSATRKDTSHPWRLANVVMKCPDGSEYNIRT